MPRLIVAAATLLAACARIAPPPGGPSRASPPVIVGVFPDSDLTRPGFRDDAEFRFDEVISEGSQPNFGYGTGTLEQLILLSPDTAVPVVRWHRDRITVHPRDGWRPNTLYRIQLLPGIRDLQVQSRLLDSGAVISFTTSDTMPHRRLIGRAVDWITQRGLTRALIEAIHLPDSLRYRMIADSTGRFVLTPLPPGAYLVVATADQNTNHRRDASEAWDSVTVPATRDSAGEIWTFPRDTLPPRIQTIARQDSFAIAVTFTKPIDPSLRLGPDSVRVLALPDSATIGAYDALPKAVADSVHRKAVPPKPPLDSAARQDSIRRDSIARATPAPAAAAAASDTTPRAAEDLPSEPHPPLGTVLVIHSTGTVRSGTRYYVELHGVRTAGGLTGPPVSRAFETPKAETPKPDSSTIDSTKTDSTKTDSTKTDSTKAESSKVDSLRATPTPRDTTRGRVPPTAPSRGVSPPSSRPSPILPPPSPPLPLAMVSIPDGGAVPARPRDRLTGGARGGSGIPP